MSFFALTHFYEGKKPINDLHIGDLDFHDSHLWHVLSWLKASDSLIQWWWFLKTSLLWATKFDVGLYWKPSSHSLWLLCAALSCQDYSFLVWYWEKVQSCGKDIWVASVLGWFISVCCDSLPLFINVSSVIPNMLCRIPRNVLQSSLASASFPLGLSAKLQKRRMRHSTSLFLTVK